MALNWVNVVAIVPTLGQHFLFVGRELEEVLPPKWVSSLPHA